MARLLATLTLCLSAVAAADWAKVRTLSGTPQDVVMADAGLVVVSSSGATGGAAAIFLDGGSAFELPAGNYVGAGILNDTCLIGLQTNRAFAASGCSLSAPNLSGSFTPRRYRVSPGGVGLATVTSTLDELLSGPVANGTYALAGPLTWAGRAPRSIGVAAVNGVEFSVFNEAANGLVYSVDGGAPIAVALGVSANDAVPFPLANAPAVLVATTGGGLLLVPDVRSSVQAVKLLPLPTGALIDTVAMTAGEGSFSAPRGYGLATTAGGPVYSPIPDPSHPGELWVKREGAPALSGRVHCLDASWCAGFGALGEVFVLHNAAAPLFEFDAGVLSAGVTTTLRVDAGDPDGDPIFVTWQTDGGTLAPRADSGALDGREIDFTPRIAGCTGTVGLTITVWDGLVGHETVRSLGLPVVSSAVGTAAIAPQSPTVAAGSAAIAFTASLDGGCQPLGALVWSPDGSTANPFNWTPPRNVCSAAGLSVPVGFTSAVASASTTVTVTPWGPPETPVFPSPARQDAGTTVIWSPLDPGHVCATSAGFPGTVLHWTFDPRGFAVTVVDGGLQLEAPACQAGTFRAQATRSVAGDPAVVSDAGSLEVEIVSVLAPLSSTTPFSMGLHYDAGSPAASGTFSVGADCLGSRRLEATVEVRAGDGGVVSSGRFSPVPGPWSLPVPGGCAGGDFTVLSALLEDGGYTGATDQAAIHSRVQPVVVGALSPSVFEVSCGEGAHGILSLSTPADTCGAGEVTITPRAGPEVTITPVTSRSVELQTSERSFELLGRTLELEVTVDAGVDGFASDVRTVSFTGPRFVSVSARMTPLEAVSEDLVDVELTAQNTSACAVDAVSLSAQLGGLVPAVDSARTSAGPLGAVSSTDTLTLDPLPLGPGASVVVHFTARPRLLATPTLSSSASVRGVPVDLPATMVAASPACGCASSPGADLILVVLTLWRARKRRESP